MFEGEHKGWDIRALRDCLQYLLNRAQIAKAGSAAPAVTPTVRIPPNGNEMNQFFAKQALDLGYYGIIWPHISTVEEAYNAVAACRYPAPEGQAALRAGGHPRRRADAGGALLGRHAAGILRARRRLAARRRRARSSSSS